ncbi:uroporphyrinogen-III synthase [Sinomonas sp. JGH33]|uniref:Uroporphyrinogen-III synthase n=1 Tax=Sinomonas terricola TaxID=3110330 RepID=A0ABU5T0I2_9MICC|nr:uroporphyrinogen-III synthase [Sinomonas sp. JGH33]MEA5453159.1 uroporphyrinogen-III synthase [Sinomonas sp. JGH33]
MGQGLHRGRPLAGRRVLLTRSPDRAGAMAEALAAAGAEPLLLPLIDFETARDAEGLDAALSRLAAGEYAWLVVSSITTVRALKQFAAERGSSLRGLVPEGVRIATIGPSSRRVIEAEGLRVDLAPGGKQSAEGLVELWAYADDGGASGADGAGTVRILIPQSGLAGPTLSAGLVERGWDVDVVTAYETVDYPAEPTRRLTAELAVGTEPSPAVVLSPEDARRELGAGRLDAIVAASPSAARRICEALRPLVGARLVAIGQPTAAEFHSLGVNVAATAATPTPEGIVDAVVEAVLLPRDPPPHTSPPSVPPTHPSVTPTHPQDTA